MNANEITFGIEMETHLPASDTCQPGPHRFGRQVAWLPQGWLGDADPSIVTPAGRKACEFVSPILKGREGLEQLLDAIAAINDHGAKVNDSCGLHIHVGWTGDETATARLIHLVANFEKAIYATSGTHKRETGRWCASISRHGDAQTARQNAQIERYHVLNLTNLHAGHVEFRVFCGSTNATKIVSYIRLCLALVAKAAESQRPIRFIAQPTVETSPVHRSGEGQTQLTRAFYAFGWIKGRVKRVFGLVDCEGAADLQATKKELMRLAKKYDNESR